MSLGSAGFVNIRKENVPWTDFIEVLGGVAKLGPQSADELEQLTEVACLKALLVGSYCYSFMVSSLTPLLEEHHFFKNPTS